MRLFRANYNQNGQRAYNYLFYIPSARYILVHNALNHAICRPRPLGRRLQLQALSGKRPFIKFIPPV